MTVRMPTENISWTCLNEVDLVQLIEKMIERNKQTHPRIEYNIILQFLEFEFSNEHQSVPYHLNDLLFEEETEGYIQRKGKIGTKECKLRIIRNRPLKPKEIGKVFKIGKYWKAITYDSRVLDDECESAEEAKNLLLKQPQIELNLNWTSKMFRAIGNFKNSLQIFRSLEAEIDVSEFSSMSDLHLLPLKVIETLNDIGIERFGEYMNRFDADYDSLHSVEALIGRDGVHIIYDKIGYALQRMTQIHCAQYECRGVVKSKQSKAIILSADKREIECVNGHILRHVNCGSVVEYELDEYSHKAVNVCVVEKDMIGFADYVDIIAMNQYFGSDYNQQQMHENDNLVLDKFTLQQIISDELRHCDTFSLHALPGIVERRLNIIWDPKKFGFPSLRKIFEDPDIKRVCRLDNAASTALVSTVAKSKEIPTMQWIKEGFVRVLMKYGDERRGYRMKRRGAKKTDIRDHFAKVNKKHLKPRAWFGIDMKELIRACDDVIRVDDTTEADGVWLLFLK